MSLLTTLPFDQIIEVHLQQLIDNATPEARDLDFKLKAPSNSDADKKEFLKDITSFANTAGGHMVIGIAERGGVAGSLVGLTAATSDAEILRLEQILLASVEPRLIGVHMRPITLAAGGYALVIHVPKSWNPPHRVTFGGTNRYHLRHSNGAYEPSVEQLRDVFLGGAELERRLLDFRVDRLSRLETGDRGLKLSGRGKLIIHTVPLGGDASTFSMPSFSVAVNLFMPTRFGGGNYRYNLDGILLYAVDGASPGTTPGYSQIFRDGRLELATSKLVHNMPSEHGGYPVLPGITLLQYIRQDVRRALAGARQQGTSFPMAVMVSLLDVSGTRMPASYPAFSTPDLVDRDNLLFAPVLIDDGKSDAEWDQALLPIFNALWNAYGYERCFNMTNDDGSWKGTV